METDTVPSVDELKLQRDGHLAFGPKHQPVERWPRWTYEEQPDGSLRAFQDWGEGTGIVEYEIPAGKWRRRGD